MSSRTTIIILSIVTALAILATYVFLLLWSPLKGVDSEEIWTEDQILDTDEIPALEMTAGEDFRILVLADTQLGARPTDKWKVRKLMNILVEQTDPDFVTTVGDNTASFIGHRRTRWIISRFEAMNLPWSVTLGNHDGEGLADRTWLGNRYEEGENSLFSLGPGNIHGTGNYAVNITGESGEIVYSLIMMDSNTYRRYESGRDYDYIYNDQIQWYEWLNDGLSGSQGKPVPTMLFFHIPLPEFDSIRQEWEAGELEAAGGMREGVFCPPVNSGFFDTIKEVGTTTHIFNGHDHVNSLSAEWEEVLFTYVLKTGTGSYSDKDLQGGTLITIDGASHEIDVEHIYIP